MNSQKWGRTDLPDGLVSNLLNVVFVQQSFQIGATLFRRQALLDVDFMRPDLQNCEDTDLFVRLALAGKQGYYLNDRLMEYRVHAEQQGIDRAVPYLKDKIGYLENYQFDSEPLEKIRLSRLAKTQLLLGIRLIKKGEIDTGRQLIWAGKLAAPLKACLTMALSWLPSELRNQAFSLLRQAKS